MLLNMYGIHKLHKKMEILQSLEVQVARWIKAWEICAKESMEMGANIPTHPATDVPYLGL